LGRGIGGGGGISVNLWVNMVCFSVSLLSATSISMSNLARVKQGVSSWSLYCTDTLFFFLHQYYFIDDNLFPKITETMSNMQQRDMVKNKTADALHRFTF